MINYYMGKQLKKLRNQIPVNTELKENLKNNFQINQNKNSNRILRFVMVSLFSIVIAISFALVFFYLPQLSFQKTRAENLYVTDQVSFIDIAEGNFSAFCEYNGSIYFSIEGKGIFRYNNNGTKMISSENAQTISISPDGKFLVISYNGNIKLLDISTGKVSEIFTNKTPYVYYSDAKFLSNDSIVFVKEVVKPRKTHGFDIVESGIYKINLKTKRMSSKLADGFSPSGVDDYIVFERNGKIFLKDIKKNKETYVDEGKFPSISPDKKYIVYVKPSTVDYKLENEITVKAVLSNIWIADFDLKTKKCMTNNLPKKYINENFKNSTDTTFLEEGMYSYYNPIFSKNSKQIYAIKAYNTEGIPFRIIKIRADYNSLSPKETVEIFIQALVRRDDDFAKTLMENPPQFLTWSNPHVVGYDILNEGQKDKFKTVDADIFYSDTANAYWSINRTRFYLEPKDGKYKIIKMELLEEIEVFSSYSINNGKSLVLRKDMGKTKTLLTLDEIPKSFLPQNNFRFSSLAYSQKHDLLIFTIQEMNKGYVLVFAYRPQTKELKFIDKIDHIDNKYDITIIHLIIDNFGDHIALELSAGAKNEFYNFVAVYDLITNKKVYVNDLFKNKDVVNCRTLYWKNHALVIETNFEKTNLLYIYNAEKGVMLTY